MNTTICVIKTLKRLIKKKKIIFSLVGNLFTYVGFIWPYNYNMFYINYKELQETDNTVFKEVTH